jgi:hypothetical protein
MKIKTITLYVLLLSGICCTANAYDRNDSIGKLWKAQCKNKDMRKIRCCKEKADECLKEAKNQKERKDCKKRFKVCNSNKIVTQ